MRVLFVGRASRSGTAVWMREQAAALRRLNLDVRELGIVGRTHTAYPSAVMELTEVCASTDFDIIHAHFGLSGLVALSQWKTPVVTTFHGADVNHPGLRPIARLVAAQSSAVICVSRRLLDQLPERIAPIVEVVPCGVETDVFFPVDRSEARAALGFDDSETIIVFGGRPGVARKNFPLAQAAVARLGRPVRLIPLQGYGREQVALLFNAANLMLLTSLSEGSPQVVKEALACGCPVVATETGDVADQLEGDDISEATGFDVDDVAGAIARVLARGTRPRPDRLLCVYDNRLVAQQVADVYRRVLRA